MSYVIRVDACEKTQRLDVTFFDDALGDSVRIGVTGGGVTTALVYANRQLALVTLGAVPLLVGFIWWFMQVIEPRYTRHHETIGTSPPSPSAKAAPGRQCSSNREARTAGSRVI